jgi:GMP synthase (glutamine-hydrolysing)
VDTILILDFGSQTTQLIARRIRELSVYSRIVPGDQRLSEIDLSDVRGIILSGSPHSVYDEDAPVPDPAVYEAGLPVLGICYGLQRLIHDHGGRVERQKRREYGRARQRRRAAHPLFEGIEDGFVSWMSHGDSIEALPDGATLVAESEHGLPGCIAFPARNVVGIQFHPEVTHTEAGMQVLENFAVRIAGARRQWTMEAYAQQMAEELTDQVGENPVLLLISGGVDSTVTAAMLLEAMPPDQVHLMYIDTGLMRYRETEEVRRGLEALGAENLHIVDAEEAFLSALAGITDPEEKRAAIGDTFVRVQEAEIRAHVPGDYILAQGTLYTDYIESGRGVGSKARVIKSHHNVRSPLIEAKRNAGEVVEPLIHLYKDEVRELGRRLGVRDDIIRRHPFPGPGLAVRILGEVTGERCELLRAVDHTYISELKSRGLYDEIWQAFAVLLPIRSVGVTGDERGYGSVIGLRAVGSKDGMTADVYAFPSTDLLEISSIITNRHPEVGRVVYDVSSKPPATIEWE